MESQMREAIRSFETTFAGYTSSGYVIPGATDMLLGIDWYNTNLSLIALNVVSPKNAWFLDEATPQNYVWAHACGLVLCANLKALIK
jgi:hypothetical protein